MFERITLAEVDRDGAIREVCASLHEDDAIQHELAEGSSTRAHFLRGGLLAGGALLAAGGVMGLPALGAAAPSAAQDVKVLNYALTLEYLEAAFYAEAVQTGALSGPLLGFARTARRHEAAHVAVLQGALGSKAVPRPTFDFKGTTASRRSFARTAYTLESTGVAAYSGQIMRLSTSDTAELAISILTVEARHAAWIGALSGQPPAPYGFDLPSSMSKVLATIRKTGFIRG